MQLCTTKPHLVHINSTISFQAHTLKWVNPSNNRLKVIKVVAVLVDMDEVVAEIVSIEVEVAMMVNASPTEDVLATVVLLTLLFLLLVLSCLLQDMVFSPLMFLNLLQVVVLDRVVMLSIPQATATSLLMSGDGKVMVLSIK